MGYNLQRLIENLSNLKHVHFLKYKDNIMKDKDLIICFIIILYTVVTPLSHIFVRPKKR